jgi:uncharacterized membrane protein
MNVCTFIFFLSPHNGWRHYTNGNVIIYMTWVALLSLSFVCVYVFVLFISLLTLTLQLAFELLSEHLIK